jgi:isopenicillin-N N-acyltransferase-like protein
MMTKRLTLAVLLLATAFSRAAEVPRTKVINLKGSGDQIGREYARELGPEMKLLHEKYLKVWFKDENLHRRALGAAFLFRSFLPHEQKAEINALADATGIDPGDVMLGNCFLDLLPMTACSTVTLPKEASPDGVARFGRNLDFPALNIADKHTVVLVFHAPDKYAFAAIGWPGMIGVLTGMNEHGLTLANMEVPRNMALPQAMPYTLLYRSVLENCKTVDEAIKLLETTPRQSANNLMLMDAAGNRAVCEITPEKVTVRRGEAAAALISTNHQRGLEQDESGLCPRYDYLHDQSKREFGGIGVSNIERMLGRVAQGKMTLQSMVFEPANRIVYLATGSEAPKHPYERIDLNQWFKDGK